MKLIPTENRMVWQLQQGVWGVACYAGCAAVAVALRLAMSTLFH